MILVAVNADSCILNMAFSEVDMNFTASNKPHNVGKIPKLLSTLFYIVK